MEEVFPVAVGLARHETHDAPSIEQGIVAALALARHMVHEMIATRGPGHRERLGCRDCHCGRHV